RPCRGRPSGGRRSGPRFVHASNESTIRRAMRVLLLRPDPGNERFGLGPFFRVEPLGLEYVATALRQRGHEPAIVDLRFGHRIGSWVRRTRPEIVGISCMHALEYGQVLEAARQVRRAAPEAFILVGG